MPKHHSVRTHTSASLLLLRKTTLTKYKYRTSFTYNGKRYWIRANTKADLEVKKAMKLRDLEEGKIVANCNTTLQQWAEECIETYKTNQSEITRTKYEDRIRHCIFEEIGHISIGSITPMLCQQVLNKQAGKSRTQINEVYQALKFFFRHAKANGLIATDPTENLIKPKAGKKQHRRALTAEERQYFIKVGMTDRRFFVFMLMLFCGCRPSEASECKGSDIEQVDGYNVLHIRGTKTAFSDRYVPIPDTFYDAIKNTPENEYIAVSNTGHKMTNDNRRNNWQYFKRQINLAMGAKTYRNKLVKPLPLAEDLFPYCLRHEYCTELARQGVDIRTAQKLMGHASVNLTANIYTNLTENDTVKVAAKLGATQKADVDATKGESKNATPNATAKRRILTYFDHINSYLKASSNK